MTVIRKKMPPPYWVRAGETLDEAANRVENHTNIENEKMVMEIKKLKAEMGHEVFSLAEKSVEGGTFREWIGEMRAFHSGYVAGVNKITGGLQK